MVQNENKKLIYTKVVKQQYAGEVDMSIVANYFKYYGNRLTFVETTVR